MTSTNPIVQNALVARDKNGDTLEEGTTVKVDPNYLLRGDSKKWAIIGDYNGYFILRDKFGRKMQAKPEILTVL